jgi:hypothetical protein
MEIGIGKDKGNVYFKSTHKAFLEEYGERREVPEGLMFSVMLDLARWVNNEVKEDCYFYMD